MTPKIAIIIFPGTNCDLETYRACLRAGAKPQIIRWNEDIKNLRGFDAFILPGGFSYEDRGRSGIIASKEPIMDFIRKEAEKEKPVLGICNGAQMLVESALIPELSPKDLEMSLTWNTKMKDKKLIGTGFYNDWIYIRSDASENRSVYNNFGKDVVMRIPIAHGEGRFTTKDHNVIDTLVKNEQALFRYCDAEGKISEDFPVNPNGTMHNIAGACNQQGNVLALMPHPERTEVGQPIFDSLAAYIKGDFSLQTPKLHKAHLKPPKDTIQEPLETPDIEISVKLIITDNAERTIENTMKKNGFKDLMLERSIYYAFTIAKGKNPKSIAKKLIETGLLLNLNKETPTVKIGDKTYTYDKDSGLTEIQSNGTKTSGINSFYVVDYSNFNGENLKNKLEHYFPGKEITSVIKGTGWTAKLKKQSQFDKLISTHIFHNPHAMKVVAKPTII